MDRRITTPNPFRVLALVVLAGVVACATRPAGMEASGTKVDRVRIEGTNATFVLPLSSDGGETKAVLEYPANSVWRAVPLAYADLSIPTQSIDTLHRHFVGAVSATRSFNRQPMSALVDCGTTITGAKADSYHIQLRLQTQVDSVASGRANLRTRVEATGSSAGGASVQCSSTGELERLIAVRVKLLVAGTTPTPN